jgi:hypothetical protein
MNAGEEYSTLQAFTALDKCRDLMCAFWDEHELTKEQIDQLVNIMCGIATAQILLSQATGQELEKLWEHRCEECQ